jgi:hypothetical protein
MHPKTALKRKDWLWEKYCANKTLTPDQFIERVKAIYYQYDAPLYNPGYEHSLRKKFIDFFSNINESGRDIIDIGAGTGEGLKLVKACAYNYGQYFYVEPFKVMIDQCDQLDDSVIVVNGYIEDLSTILQRNPSNQPRIYIISAVLRTIELPPINSLPRVTYN